MSIARTVATSRAAAALVAIGGPCRSQSALTLGFVPLAPIPSSPPPHMAGPTGLVTHGARQCRHAVSWVGCRLRYTLRADSAHRQYVPSQTRAPVRRGRSVQRRRFSSEMRELSEGRPSRRFPCTQAAPDLHVEGMRDRGIIPPKKAALALDRGRGHLGRCLPVARPRPNCTHARERTFVDRTTGTTGVPIRGDRLVAACVLREYAGEVGANLYLRGNGADEHL